MFSEVLGKDKQRKVAKTWQNFAIVKATLLMHMRMKVIKANLLIQEKD